MFDITLRNFVLVWEELLDAYHGRNNYGGDTAEIYSYLLAGNRPEWHGLEMGLTASRTMLEIANLFLELHGDCTIEVEDYSGTTRTWRPVGNWMRECCYDNRLHVRVTRTDGG